MLKNKTCGQCDNLKCNSGKVPEKVGWCEVIDQDMVPCHRLACAKFTPRKPSVVMMEKKSCRNCLACGGAPTDCWVLCVHARVIEERRTPDSDGKSTLVNFNRADLCRHYIPTRDMRTTVWFPPRAPRQIGAEIPPYPYGIPPYPYGTTPIDGMGQGKTYRPDRIKAAKPQFIPDLSRRFPETPNPEVTPGTIVYPPADTVELNAKRSLALRLWPTDKLIEIIRLMQTGYTMVDLHMELTRRMKKGTV